MLKLSYLYKKGVNMVEKTEVASSPLQRRACLAGHCSGKEAHEPICGHKSHVTIQPPHVCSYTRHFHRHNLLFQAPAQAMFITAGPSVQTER